MELHMPLIRMSQDERHLCFLGKSVLLHDVGSAMNRQDSICMDGAMRLLKYLRPAAMMFLLCGVCQRSTAQIVWEWQNPLPQASGLYVYATIAPDSSKTYHLVSGESGDQLQLLFTVEPLVGVEIEVFRQCAIILTGSLRRACFELAWYSW